MKPRPNRLDGKLKINFFVTRSSTSSTIFYFFVQNIQYVSSFFSKHSKKIAYVIKK